MLTCLQGLAAAGAAHPAVRGPAGRAGAGHAGPLPLQLQDSRNVADYEKHYEHYEHYEHVQERRFSLNMWPIMKRQTIALSIIKVSHQHHIIS